MSALNSRNLARLAMFLVSWSLSSCATSKNPLSDPEQSKPDARLFGQWKPHEAHPGQEYLFIGRAGRAIQNAPAGIMIAHTVDLDPNHQLQSKTFAFFVTRIGEDSYFNLFHTSEFDGSNQPPRWRRASIDSFVFLKCAVSGNRLTLWPMQVDGAAQAVQSGKLEGKVEKDAQNNVKAVTISSSTVDLVRFLKNGGDKVLFDDKGRSEFTRVQ